MFCSRTPSGGAPTGGMKDESDEYVGGEDSRPTHVVGILLVTTLVEVRKRQSSALPAKSQNALPRRHRSSPPRNKKDPSSYCAVWLSFIFLGKSTAHYGAKKLKRQHHEVLHTRSCCRCLCLHGQWLCWTPGYPALCASGAFGNDLERSFHARRNAGAVLFGLSHPLAFFDRQLLLLPLLRLLPI
jgi:hypothetical protein